MSSATLATALTGFGIVASPAMAGVATVFGLFSVGFATVSKRLERNSVSELVLKALTDKRISDSEFATILREVQKYHELKAEIRAGIKKTKTENKEAQTPDLDKLKGELRKELKQEFQKEDKSTHRRIQVRFERVKTGFNLLISKEKSRTSN